jgi:hypothetical protein
VSDAFPRHGVTSAIPVIGALVRHSFYLVGSVVFAIIGVILLAHQGPTVKPPAQPPPGGDKPGFHINDADLARLSHTAYVLNFQPSGRIEARQYGQLTDRGPDFTIALFLIPDFVIAAGDVNQELGRLRSYNILRGVGPYGNGPFYDLNTRFGQVRATEMRADVDGQRKQCIGFVSRFDTPFAHLSGWHCTAGGAKPDAIALACILDQLVLDSTLALPEADAFFRTHAALPPSCSADPVTQTTDTRTYVPRQRIDPPPQRVYVPRQPVYR